MSEKELNSRLNQIGWGIFLLLVGIVWLIPGDAIPDGSLFFSGGLIMIIINLVKKQKGIRTGNGNVIFGFVLIGIGIIDLLDSPVPVIAALLILWGISILFKAVRTKQ